MKVCGHCRGTGRNTDFPYLRSEDELPCPTCDGRGTIAQRAPNFIPVQNANGDVLMVDLDELRAKPNVCEAIS